MAGATAAARPAIAIAAGGCELRDGLREDLYARAALYAYASRLFAREPDEGLIAFAKDPGTAEVCAWAGEEAVGAQGEIAGGISRTPLRRLRADYTELFVGTGKIPVPIWESVWASGEGVLFTERTLAVREAYRAQGMLPQGYPNVADDELACELSFLAALSRKAVLLQEAGDGNGLRAVLSAHRSFLDGHLLKWAAPFADALGALGERASIYSPAARLASSLCEADSAFLERTLPTAA